MAGSHKIVVYVDGKKRRTDEGRGQRFTNTKRRMAWTPWGFPDASARDRSEDRDEAAEDNEDAIDDEDI